MPDQNLHAEIEGRSAEEIALRLGKETIAAISNGVAAQRLDQELQASSKQIEDLRAQLKAAQEALASRQPPQDAAPIVEAERIVEEQVKDLPTFRSMAATGDASLGSGDGVAGE